MMPPDVLTISVRVRMSNHAGSVSFQKTWQKNFMEDLISQIIRQIVRYIIFTLCGENIFSYDYMLSTSQDELSFYDIFTKLRVVKISTFLWNFTCIHMIFSSYSSYSFQAIQDIYTYTKGVDISIFISFKFHWDITVWTKTSTVRVLCGGVPV